MVPKTGAAAVAAAGPETVNATKLGNSEATRSTPSTQDSWPIEPLLKRQARSFAGEDVEFRQTRGAMANCKLAEFRRQCWRLADLAHRGIVHKQNAVDLLYEVAQGHALDRAHGVDRVTSIIGEAFAGSDFRPWASEVA
jgi:hypothetical protein